MRKFLGVLGLILILAITAAPAAFAQDTTTARDPFLPLISETPAGSTDPGAPTDPTVPVDPDPDPVDPLPDTGSSTTSWFGVAYFLVAFGGGAVVLSKVLGPTPVSSR